MKSNFFFRRKEIWVPTWRTCLLGLALAMAGCLLLAKVTPPFLSPNRPLHARVLVVEGWVDDHSLESAIALSKNYDLLICGGGPIEKGHVFAGSGTYANFGVERLRKLGYTGTNLIAVPAAKARRDRTYNSALGIRSYLLKNGSHRQIDLISGGVHARRSWLLYQLACRPEIEVGVYATRDIEFDPQRWYRTSAGVRTVISEAVAYLYARFLFHPPATPLPEPAPAH